jgi:hypothetical protein
LLYTIAMSFTVGKLRVLIATTNGPVDIQLLTEEDAAIGRSVACIGGTTETADIASAYHAFVVRPTGVIEGRFGHSCYRMDVSARIDAGSSWQLGVLAAHALLAAGRLAQENDIADGILWATGSVRPVDLTVGAVSHVPEKLANSFDRLKQELNAQRPVLLAIPGGNEPEVSASARQEISDIGAELVVVSHAQALLDVLGMKLPGAASKASALAVPQQAVSAKPRRRMYAWATASVLIGVVAAGAVVLTGIRSTSWLSSQAGGAATPPEPATASRPGPRGVELVPEKIPFIRTSDRERIRDEYLRAPNYKALAMNTFESHFVSGLPSQEIADKSAVDNCESTKRRPSADTALAEVEYRCELFASGAVVVTQRSNIAMPPMPWVNASVQRPFVAAELPMASQETKDATERRYGHSPRSKALVISPNGRLFPTSAETGPEEAMRRTLERCGYVSKAACLVIALDDTFVAAVPTSARAVGLYRQDALFALQIEVRAEVARRLATSNEGWQAVALGATGRAGAAVGAISERSAVDGAMENCAMFDHDCHIAVIGPFLVEAWPAPPTQLPLQRR